MWDSDLVSDAGGTTGGVGLFRISREWVTKRTFKYLNVVVRSLIHLNTPVAAQRNNRMDLQNSGVVSALREQDWFGIIGSMIQSNNTR